MKSNTELALQRMKHHYDQGSAEAPYDIGVKIWVYTPKTRKGLSKKLTHHYHGPYRIVSKLSPAPVVANLQTLDNRPVSVPVHANRLKPCCDSTDRPIVPPASEIDKLHLNDVDLLEESFVEQNENLTDEQPQEQGHNNETPFNEPMITRPEDRFQPQEIKSKN